MRRGWKRLAERASNAAFDDNERRDALVGALQGDWRDEAEDLVGHLRDVLDDHQGDLFGESVTDQIEALRGQAAGCPLAGAVLDSAARAVAQGYRGDEALARAAGDALLERAASGRRQVEEHWLACVLGSKRRVREELHRRRNREPKGALHEYAIAGVLHLDDLAHLRQSQANAAAVERQAFLPSRSLGLDEQETKEKLAGMLRRHEEEWDSFVDSPEPRSFVAQWIARGQ